MYDKICKFLAENFFKDFATWLLGEPITLTKVSPMELYIEPILADALMSAIIRSKRAALGVTNPVQS